MNIKKKFGMKIKQIREESNFSQENLAFKANLDRTYISSIERGQRNVSIEVIEKLALALEVNIQILFEFENE